MIPYARNEVIEPGDRVYRMVGKVKQCGTVTGATYAYVRIRFDGQDRDFVCPNSKVTKG